MTKSMRPKKITIGHDIAFLYICFAFYTDLKIPLEEMKVIILKHREWYDNPGGSEPIIALDETTKWFESLEGSQVNNELNKCIERIKKKLKTENLNSIIADLNDIAKADGTVVKNEINWIEMITERLGLD